MRGEIKMKSKSVGAVWVAVGLAAFAVWVLGCQRGEEGGGGRDGGRRGG